MATALKVVRSLPVDGKPASPPTVDRDSTFDDSPLVIGGFTLRSRGAAPAVEEPRPTLRGWQVAFQYASASQESSPYWLGDLLLYAEDRADWREKLDQAKTVTHLSRHTLENQMSVCRKVRGRAREVSPSISHAAVVTKLPPKEQEVWLEQARAGEWTVWELTQAIRAHQPSTEGRADAVFDIEVTVCVTMEAETAGAAERAAWNAVKHRIAEWRSPMLAARLIAAHARPK